jgi:hypothetical protein
VQTRGIRTHGREVLDHPPPEMQLMGRITSLKIQVEENKLIV